MPSSPSQAHGQLGIGFADKGLAARAAAWQHRGQYLVAARLASVRQHGPGAPGTPQHRQLLFIQQGILQCVLELKALHAAQMQQHLAILKH